jgi:hypothetical protein
MAARRGMALMLVVAVIALASVLGLVMLSSATLANRSSANQGRLLSGEYLAQSGINLALYYLQYPDRAPLYQINSDGYWAGTAGEQAIASSVDGTVNVTVTRDSSNPWVYEVVSTGTSGTQAETQITRTTGARVLVRSGWDVDYAGAFNYATQINPGFTLNGDAYTSGNLSIKGAAGVLPAGSVTGYGWCGSYTPKFGTSWLEPGKKFQQLANPSAGSPLPSAIFNYKTGYKWGAGSYDADIIPSTTTSWSAGTVPAASASNPAHVFYFHDSALSNGGTFQLNDNVVFDGTLVIDGDLNVRGAGIVITRVNSNYPALIVTGKMDIAHKQKNITVNGTCYIGQQLKQTIINSPVFYTDYSRFTVNGGLLIGSNSAAPFATTFTVQTTVNYDAAHPPAPIQLKVNKGVSVLRWGLP